MSKNPMANRPIKSSAGGSSRPGLAMARKPRTRLFPILLAAVGLPAYVILGYCFFHEQSAPIQALAAIGFISLAMTAFLQATRRRGPPANLIKRVREGESTDFGKQLRAGQASHPGVVQIPGLGEVRLRLLGGVGVFIVSTVWWLTPWAPIVVKPPVFNQDLTALLGEDLVAAMLVLPDDHMAIVQKPLLQPHYRKMTKLIRDDASQYHLAIRSMLSGDFNAARRQLDAATKAGGAQEAEMLTLRAQLEMYAARFGDAIGYYDRALKLKQNDPMLWCQVAAAYIHSAQYQKAAAALTTVERLCQDQPSKAAFARAGAAHLQSIVSLATAKTLDEPVRLVEDGRDSIQQSVGKSNSLAAANANNQAVLYVLQAKYPNALELFNLAKTDWSKDRNLGPEDPHLVSVRSNLAALNYAQGRYAEADELLRSIESIPAEILPKDHPASIVNLNLRAALRRAYGDYDGALAAAEQARKTAETQLSPNHPCTAAVVDNLGMIYADVGRYAKAYQCSARTVNIVETIWGNEHPYLAEDLNHMAAVRLLQEDYADSAKVSKRALQVAERSLGKSHPVAADIEFTRGRLEIAQDHPQSARKSLERAQDIYDVVYEKSHPKLARVLSWLASLSTTKATAEDAIDQYKRAIEMMEKSVGKENPKIAQFLGGLAKQYILAANFKEATDCLDRALGIQKKMLPPTHPDLAATYEIYASLLTKMSPPDTARAEEMQNLAKKVLAGHQAQDRDDNRETP